MTRSSDARLLSLRSDESVETLGSELLLEDPPRASTGSEMRLRRRDRATLLPPTRHFSASTAACRRGREWPALGYLFQAEPGIPPPHRRSSCHRRQYP